VVDPADNKAVTIFAVGTDKYNWVDFRAKNGTLYLEQRVAGITTKEQFQFVKSTDRFWRFRHDASADSIAFETSADGAVWITKWTVKRTFPLTAVRMELSAGTSELIAAPGVAIFDNLRLGPN
jgi:hypothetical protein